MLDTIPVRTAESWLTPAPLDIPDPLQNPKKTTSIKTKSTSRSAFFNSRVLIGFALCSVGLLSALAGVSQSVTGTIATKAPAQTPGTWEATGSLATARSVHTATLLPSAKVLVAGGYNGPALSSAELYDPASGNWTATSSMGTARGQHTATLLPSGKVLVAGGFDLSNALRSAELYDPVTGTWTATGSMGTARYDHTATLLPNGQVLVAAGTDSDFRPLGSAELYDPASGTWTATGSMVAARGRHTATLLPNGKVLVAGGFNGLSSAELYDPASGTWSATGSMATARFDHTATLLPNGKVLVAGGSNGVALSSAELYDPASGTWTLTGSLTFARTDHTAILLPNGEVLASGGSGSSFNVLASAELYDPATGALQLTSAASVKGPFEIHLPLTGTLGIEDRTGGPKRLYQIVLTFNNDVTSVDNVTTSCGTVRSATVDGGRLVVSLVGVTCTADEVTITLNGVQDDQGNTLDTSVTFGLLVGDVTRDGIVNSADIERTQSFLGQDVASRNFRADINEDGQITRADVTIVKSQLGNRLP